MRHVMKDLTFLGKTIAQVERGGHKSVNQDRCACVKDGKNGMRCEIIDITERRMACEIEGISITNTMSRHKKLCHGPMKKDRLIGA